MWTFKRVSLYFPGIREMIVSKERALIRCLNVRILILIFFDPCPDVNSALTGRLDGGDDPNTE